MKYTDKLRNPKWQRKRLQIFSLAGFRCEDCGREDMELHVHHCDYVPNVEPWQYDRELLMCLCYACHEKRQKIENSIRVDVGKIARMMKPDELETVMWDVCEVMANRWRKINAESFA